MNSTTRTTSATATNGRTASGSAAREKVTFPANVTQFVTLEFDAPQEVAGRGGPQAQYFLGSQRIMWLDLEVAQAITATGARAGDEVAITKRETLAGGRKSIQWEVEKVEDESHEPEQNPRNWAAANRHEMQPPREEPRQAPAPRTTAAPAPPLEQQLRQSLNLPTATTESWEATSAAAPNQIALAMCAAIRATQFAEAYGARIGKPVAFGTEDIRAIANTLYISQTRGGN